MGVIQRQGIKTTLINFLGAAIGAISVLFIYPLNDEIYGYALWFYNVAFLLIPFASMGVISLIIKFYPAFSKSGEKTNHGFLSLIISLLTGAYLIFLLLWLFFKKYILSFLEWLEMDPGKLEENEVYILVFLYILIMLFALINHSTNQLRIVVPNIIFHLGYKIFLPLLVLIQVHYALTQSQFSFFLTLYFGVALVIMLLYLKFLGALRFGKIKRPYDGFSFKSMATFSLFGSLNSLSGTLATRIDTVMIPFIQDMMSNGFYGKVLFMANVVEMPTRAITQIAGPIISKAWESNDTSEIDVIYKKASANLFLIGSFAFILLWFILDDLIMLSGKPDSFPNARTIFFYLALSKLFDMLTSVNNQIIGYSKAYKFNLIFIFILGILNVSLNYYFINKHGIVGAAMATALSLFVYNLIKLLFIFIKFGLQPFTLSTIKTAALFILFFYLFDTVAINVSPIISIISKVIIVSLIFGILSYFLKISDDINNIVLKFLKRQ